MKRDQGAGTAHGAKMSRPHREPPASRLTPRKRRTCRRAPSAQICSGAIALVSPAHEGQRGAVASPTKSGTGEAEQTGWRPASDHTGPTMGQAAAVPSLLVDGACAAWLPVSDHTKSTTDPTAAVPPYWAAPPSISILHAPSLGDLSRNIPRRSAHLRVECRRHAHTRAKAAGWHRPCIN